MLQTASDIKEFKKRGLFSGSVACDECGTRESYIFGKTRGY